VLFIVIDALRFDFVVPESPQLRHRTEAHVNGEELLRSFGGADTFLRRGNVSATSVAELEHDDAAWLARFVFVMSVKGEGDVSIADA
jgi:hypothetical protein